MSKTLFLSDDDCRLLVEILDKVPLSPRYLPFVVDMQQRLAPISDAGPAPSADSSQPAPQVPESGCGFQLTAREPRTIAALYNLMSRLPHGDTL